MRRVFGLSSLVLVVLLAGCGDGIRELTKRVTPASGATPESEQVEVGQEPSRTVPRERWAGWEEESDWDITYRVSKDEDDWNEEPVPPHKIRARYKAPHHILVEREGYAPLRALADGEGTRVYFPKYGLMLWMPGDSAPAIDPVDISLRGKQGPLYWDKIEYGIFLRQAMAGEGGYRLLPDETVAGRECIVIEYKARPGSATVRWLDKRYGIPIAYKYVRNGKVLKEYRAEKAHINEGIDTSIFSLKIPAGVPSYKGRFMLDEAEVIAYYRKAGIKSIKPCLPPLPEQTGPIKVLRPRYLPDGFMWIITVPSGSDSDEDWIMTMRFINASGGTIEFTQETEIYREQPKPDEIPGFKPTTVRGLPAHVKHSEKPYPSIIIAWEERGMELWLEGTGISEEELMKTAQSTAWLTIDPEERMEDPR